MKKKKQIKHLLFSLITLLSIFLSSCAPSIISYVPYDSFLEDIDTYEEEIHDGYLKPASYHPYTFKNKNNEDEVFNTFQDVFRHQKFYQNISSLKTNKLLVIPIDFDDYPSSNLEEGTEGSLEVIKNAFFGQNENNAWRSVAGYYNESSYGKFILDGKVTNWFRSSYLASDIVNNSAKANVVRNIYNEALAWYEDNYDDLSSFYVDGVRSNGIPVYLIYSHPSASGEGARNKMFWAFTINQNNTLACWSSYHLTYLKYGKPDTHTYIHEVGHLFGLVDYYNTDGLAYGPTGRVDMMDYSVGDHTGYSKMLLNWTRPYYVLGDATITIRPFYVSGDLILIKNEWNYTAMDEYLLIEFYSPNGLNAYDSRVFNNESYLMSKAGIKVYHVDARLAFLTNNNLAQTIGYVSDGLYNKEEVRLGIIHSNTSSTTYQNNRLYHLLEKSGENSFLNGHFATNETLFYKGDSFGLETFENYKLNDNTLLGYTFNIDELTNTYATISFKKL
ncbi:MAG: immune inhibitor A domain-containing protein [Bacilli bacterium]|jgi:M6 family metalloprotease-like protein|nr:hypothetical protein [Bacilli bacterium]NLN80560.1 hypothetical protein [Erysipelotrichia bacterium]